MTTSQQNTFLSEILEGQPIPTGKLAYFRARLSNRIHELVLEEFMRLEKEGKVTRAELARRINRKPEQVTRWLGAAGNWTIDTFSDLLLGMGCEPDLSIISLNKLSTNNGEVQIANKTKGMAVNNLSRVGTNASVRIVIAPHKREHPRAFKHKRKLGNLPVTNGNFVTRQVIAAQFEPV